MDTQDLKQRTQDAVATSQAVAVRTKAEEITDFVTTTLAPSLDDVLQQQISRERFARIVLGAFRKTPKLMECSKPSLASALLECAALNLEPNTPMGYCYLIPRKNQGVQEATLQISYKGYMELARRSGEIVELYADVVCKGDEFQFNKGKNSDLYHKNKFQSEEVEYVYAYAKLKSGGFVFEVLPIREVEALSMLGARGQGKRTPWDTDYAAMCQKTAVLQIKKWLPLSAEMKRAFEADADNYLATTLEDDHDHETETIEVPND